MGGLVQPGTRDRRKTVNQNQQSLPLKLLILLMVTAAVFLLISNRVEAGVPAGEPARHRVLAGESLWEIASEMEADRDIRALVGDIQQLNQLSGPTIQPGQVLLLPAP